jgi:hypothetical protein
MQQKGVRVLSKTVGLAANVVVATLKAKHSNLRNQKLRALVHFWVMCLPLLSVLQIQSLLLQPFKAMQVHN